MAVRGGFFKVIVFICFILSIGTLILFTHHAIRVIFLLVSSVLPAECDNLLLFIGGESYNQREFLYPPGVRRKIWCGCSDD